MGYNTYITGELTVTPPIDEKDFKDWAAEDYNGYFVYEQVEGDEDVRIVNGQIVVVGQSPGHTIAKYAFDESIKAYDFSESVESFVAKCKSMSRIVSGSFDGDGEESDDFWKLSVTNNDIVLEEGTIMYASEQYADLRAIGEKATAHGNVVPRPDGQRVLCGGAPKCADCQDEYERLSKLIYGRP